MVSVYSSGSPLTRCQCRCRDSQKRFAEDAAEAVIGVRDVQNGLRVRQAGGPNPPTRAGGQGILPDPGTTDDMIDADAPGRRTGPKGLVTGTGGR